MGVPHIRVELIGTLSNGAERWSTGFATAPPTGGALADVETLAVTATSLFLSDFWGSSGINLYFPLSSRFTGARVQQLEADGTVRATHTTLLATSSAGSGTVSLPPQCSVVASLRTPTAGPRGRGRMYLPVPAVAALVNSGRIGPGPRQGFADGLQLFFNDWNADALTAPVGVASGMGGFVTTVTRIEIGDVVDTQRRRRDALPEDYLARAIIS